MANICEMFADVRTSCKRPTTDLRPTDISEKSAYQDMPTEPVSEHHWVTSKTVSMMDSDTRASIVVKMSCKISKLGSALSKKDRDCIDYSMTKLKIEIETIKEISARYGLHEEDFLVNRARRAIGFARLFLMNPNSPK